jgi:hypothetical protein
MCETPEPGARLGEEAEMPDSPLGDLERDGYGAYRKMFEDTDDTRRA